MAGQAVLISKRAPGFSEEGFLLPTTAIFTDSARDRTLVWVIDPSTQEVSMREVVTGKLTAQGILVTEGLAAGEWVVAAGVYSLHEGQKVDILPVKLGSKGEQIEIDGAS
ncbi:MAG: Multidrug resistance protein MdtA [Chlamydiae bacterium]|nr:Multidrug resistance protein MdtA [Chlamydiota bacterium]